MNPARFSLAASVLLLAQGSCRCGETSPSAPIDASPSAPASAAVPSAPTGALPLSLPFAAARGPGGDVYVAGLVASRGVIAMGRLAPSGAVAWVADALTDVAWTPDAEVRVMASDTGLVVVWRGLRSKTLVRQAVAVDPQGKLRGDPQAVGPGSCATDDGLVWPEETEGGTTAIMRRPFAWGEKASLGTVTRDLDPVLACATHRVFVLEQGEEDLGLEVLSSDGNKASVPLISASASDDRDEHDEFTDGDDFGIVNATERGKLLFRETTPNLSRWRTLDKSLEKDDDIVDVDGDHLSVYVVYTRDASDRCDGGAAGSDIRLVRGRRAAAKPDVKDDDQLVSSAACGTDVGPFWNGSIGDKFVVVWSELSPREGGAPPIAGIAYRVMGDGDAKRIAQPSDGMAFAGCDDKKCYAVALTRTDADAMAPGAPKLLSFP